ncbi:SMI1 / KNR4 family (SUKH-1) [Thermoactinomyces sp. DSM 45891]|uniref:SMI1/KNR4 family protein n=1 Tax=Thermoactinomyces sp. DSM 45891 TaxID=1761907 RepID=UPI00091EA2EF|nr:SMI1/KNR4 family protein [Thermoactinomyces sp. DSM 45891]SFX31421.1 SMI1 / KNR4 family (SUKH-1) [Thermoactinomyces sp. DSM 45891]
MEVGDLVSKTLSCLKSNLQSNQLEIVNERGTKWSVSFKFNEPVHPNVLSDFESEYFRLPPDYKNFLLISNGATMFTPEFGGGYEIHSLDKMKEIKNYHDYLPTEWWPIVSIVDGDYFVNSTKPDQQDYLYLSNAIVDESQKMNMTFELWLDRLVVAQGSKFWEWDLYSGERFYKSY